LSAPSSGRFTPEKDPITILQEAGWASRPVGTGTENLAPPGFDPRTVQPVASRYIDYAIPAAHDNDDDDGDNDDDDDNNNNNNTFVEKTSSCGL
jgi:hypothetical protein